MSHKLEIWFPEVVSFSDSGNDRTIQGYAAIYYDPLVPGSEYRPSEGTAMRIHRGAFDQILSKNPNVKAHYAHDRNEPLGSVEAGNLSLSTDSKGLKFSLYVPRTSRGNDVLTLVKGDGQNHGPIVKGMSFTGTRGFDRWTKEGSLDVLNLYRWSDLEEISITSMPAFRGTSVFSAEISRQMETDSRRAIAENLRREMELNPIDT